MCSGSVIREEVLIKEENPSIYQKRNTITNHKIPKERKTGILQRAKGIYGKITSKADQKIEKRL